MSEKELDRVAVMGRVQSKDLKLSDAARLLGRSYRQTKRIWQRYRQRGGVAMQHGNVGKPSHRARSAAERREVLQLVRKHYGGAEGQRFGPTLAAEHLEREHGRKVAAETLRRWMLAEGLWSRMRKRSAARQRRERKEHFGELLQLDGSHHAWLEQRGPRGCVMDLVDDATSVGEIGMEEQETIWGATHVLHRWIKRYGVPLALYVDRKNVYVREPTAQERVSGQPALTQFGRMCAQLGIRMITAHSPQAKGRVERAHGTHQDRLVKHLRVQNINTHQAANRFIAEQYLAEHNQRFAKAAAQVADYHRPAPSAERLHQIFRLEYERTISNDWVVRHNRRHFQLPRQSRHYAPARSKVTVCEWEDGQIGIEYRGQVLSWQEITAPVRRQDYTERPEKVPDPVDQPKRVKTIPAAEHPWRRKAVSEKQRKAIRRWRDNSLAAVPSSASP
jgi:transposase